MNLAQKVIWVSGCGFAAGCEAGLRPAVGLRDLIWGYAPGSGLAHKHRAKPGPGA